MVGRRLYCEISVSGFGPLLHVIPSPPCFFSVCCLIEAKAPKIALKMSRETERDGILT